MRYEKKICRFTQPDILQKSSKKVKKMCKKGKVRNYIFRKKSIFYFFKEMLFIASHAPGIGLK